MDSIYEKIEYNLKKFISKNTTVMYFLTNIVYDLIYPKNKSQEEFTNKYGFIIKDRSSIAVRGLFTHAGVIDAGYIGEIKILFHNVNQTSVKIDKGDKIAQLVPKKVISFEIEEIDKLHQTQRGDNGFGSTGK